MEAKNGLVGQKDCQKKATEKPKRAKGKQERAKERQVGPTEGQRQQQLAKGGVQPRSGASGSQRPDGMRGVAEGLCKSRQKESNGKRKQWGGRCES